jgi:hypothetical protein
MANWATTADVMTYTGVAVVEQDVTEAQGVIDVYAGVTEEARSNLKSRDIRLLKQAVCYQAAWAAGQQDVFSRVDVSNVNQDGMQFTVTEPDAMIIAPLAKRCLDRLTWRKSRSVNVRSTDSLGNRATEGDFLTDGGYFENLGWRRM